MARRHVMTARRRVALRKAQLASARKRKGSGRSKPSSGRTVTMYHYTSPKAAQKIVKKQKFKTAGRFTAPGNTRHHVYGTRVQSKFYASEFRGTRNKTVAVAFKAPAHAVRRDPNDAWFLKHPALKYAKNKPSPAYMVHKKHIHGARIVSHTGKAGI